MKQLITYRPHQADDEAFLFATYLKNNWYRQESSTMLPKKIWMWAQHKRLEKVMKNQVITVACLKDDPDVILGYGFWDEEKPFTYIKLAWRSDKLNLEKELTERIEKP